MILGLASILGVLGIALIGDILSEPRDDDDEASEKGEGNGADAAEPGQRNLLVEDSFLPTGATGDGGADADQVAPPAAENILLGGDGGEVLNGGASADRIDAGGGDDMIAGGNADDRIDAGDGDDFADGGDGDDTLAGGTGDDALDGQRGDDRLFGDEGDDLLSGAAGDDGLSGGSGDDVLIGGAGDDTLDGGDGADDLAGGHGDDRLTGGAGADALDGNAGDDWLDGRVRDAAGIDTDAGDYLNGGAGDDTLVAGQGDLATGGEGLDRFVLGDWIGGGEAARIADFDAARDEIFVVYDPAGHPDPSLTVETDPDDPALARLVLDGVCLAEIEGGAGLDPDLIRLVAEARPAE
ncbi:MAG: calcium-binding protein [Paracoccaceae bacterium]